MAYPAEYSGSDSSDTDSWGIWDLPSEGDLTPEEELYTWRRPNAYELVPKFQLLIQDYPEGLLLDALPDTYFRKFREELDWTIFGHKTLLDLMMDYSDVLQCIREGTDANGWFTIDAARPPTEAQRTTLSLRLNTALVKEIKTNILKSVQFFFRFREHDFQIGLPVFALQNIYKELFGCLIRFEVLGFSSLESLCYAFDGPEFSTFRVDEFVTVIPTGRPWGWPGVEPNPLPAHEEERLNIPKDMVGLNATYYHLDYSRYIKEGEVLDIDITRIFTPSRFYFCFSAHEGLLKSFKDGLNNFYTSDTNYRMPVEMMRPGQVCVVTHYNSPRFPSVWERAIIVEAPIGGVVSVLLVDTGESSTVYTTRVKFLHKHFLAFPVLNIPACLAGISPEHEYYEDHSISMLRQFARGSPLLAEFYTPDYETPIMPIVLFQRNTDTSLNTKLLNSAGIIFNDTIPIQLLTENRYVFSSRPMLTLFERTEYASWTKYLRSYDNRIDSEEDDFVEADILSPYEACVGLDFWLNDLNWTIAMGRPSRSSANYRCDGVPAGQPVAGPSFEPNHPGNVHQPPFSRPSTSGTSSRTPGSRAIQEDPAAPMPGPSNLGAEAVPPSPNSVEPRSNASASTVDEKPGVSEQKRPGFAGKGKAKGKKLMKNSNSQPEEKKNQGMSEEKASDYKTSLFPPLVVQGEEENSTPKKKSLDISQILDCIPSTSKAALEAERASFLELLGMSTSNQKQNSEKEKTEEMKDDAAECCTDENCTVGHEETDSDNDSVWEECDTYTDLEDSDISNNSESSYSFDASYESETSDLSDSSENEDNDEAVGGEQAREEREEQARQEREEKARQEREEQARQEREEQARQEREEQARQEREEQARQEREEQARQEREEKARQEREEKARRERAMLQAREQRKINKLAEHYLRSNPVLKHTYLNNPNKAVRMAKVWAERAPNPTKGKGFVPRNCNPMETPRASTSKNSDEKKGHSSDGTGSENVTSKIVDTRQDQKNDDEGAQEMSTGEESVPEEFQPEELSSQTEELNTTESTPDKSLLPTNDEETQQKKPE